MTLKEWIDAHEGSTLDGIVLRVPSRYRENLPARKTKMALRSVWAMGENRGLWVTEPGQKSGQVFPIFDVPADELLSWKVDE